MRGVLIPIGGNEKKENKIQKNIHFNRFDNKSILSTIVEESGGKDAKIAIVPTASKIPDQVSRIYKEAFLALGCQRVYPLKVFTKNDAKTPSFLHILKEVSGILFSGGDQSKIISCIKNTEMENIIKQRFLNDNLVIAGTSAGAMCMSEKMISGSGRKVVFKHGIVKMAEGLGFEPRFIIDSHFIKRRRLGRLVEAISMYPDRLGIGLSEDTGIVWRGGDEGEIIGSGTVTLIDSKNLVQKEGKSIKGEVMSLANLNFHFLKKGDFFSIKGGELVVNLGS